MMQLNTHIYNAITADLRLPRLIRWGIAPELASWGAMER